MSPYLFNLYSERIMRQAELDNREEGIRVGGRKVNNLRYADDTTLIAENDKDLKILLNKVKEASMKAGLALNLKKTKVMSTQEINKTRHKHVSIGTKWRMVNALVFSVVMCECEKWTIKVADRKKIDAFQLWCWRRLPLRGKTRN